MRPALTAELLVRALHLLAGLMAKKSEGKRISLALFLHLSDFQGENIPAGSHLQISAGV